MVNEVYSNRSVTLLIKDDCLVIKYFGTSYSSEYKGDVIDTLAYILNCIEENTLNIYAGIMNILNIMEPTPKKTIKFDGSRYIAC
jgi:hypothetical protein